MLQRHGVGIRGPPLLRDGRFAWQRHLADGGIASVHLYLDQASDRMVAIKLLDGRVVARSHDHADRFVAEARALAGLRHPHVVPVYAAGHDDGYLWYAMEFAQLGTLSDRLRHDGPAHPVRAARWIFETLLGLDAVHTAGMLHRDIKPSNLLLARDGRVQVADFGLARHPQSEVSFRTVSGSSMGSHGYAAPELMGDAKHADVRSDLHAVSATLYHLVTGRRPGALLFLDVDAEVLEPIPPELRNFVVKGVSPDREHRWPHARAMAQDLVDATHAFAIRRGDRSRPRQWMRAWPGVVSRLSGWIEGVRHALLG